MKDTSLTIDSEKLKAIYKKTDLKTDQQKLFLVEYFNSGLNASEAIRRAGYTGNHAKNRGANLLHHPNMQKAVGLLAEELSRTNKLHQYFVTTKMIAGMQKAEEENNLTAMARFVEMYAKHLGMFKEQIELTGKDGEAIAIEQRTREDVESFKSTITGLSKRGGTRGAPSEPKS